MHSFDTSIPRVVINNWIDPKNIEETFSHLDASNGLNFVFEIDSYEGRDEFFKTFVQTLKDKGIDISKCKFNISTDDKRYSHDEWEILSDFNKQLIENGSQLEFKEITYVWSMEEVANANNNIDSTIEEIKSANLSPFEQIIKAFKTVTSREYTEVSGSENFLLSRSIYGILNTDKIVCVGYANWFKEIIDGLYNENLFCEVHSTDVLYHKTGDVGGHSSNVVYIKDEKYNIDGLFYLDACFSAVKHKGDTHELTFCLIPLDDVKHLGSSVSLTPKDDNPFFAFISDDEPKEIVGEYLIERADYMFKRHNKHLGYKQCREEFKDSLLLKSENSILTTHMRTQELKDRFFAEMGFDTKLTKETLSELLALFDTRLERKISEGDFNKQFKALIGKMREEKEIGTKTACVALKDWSNAKIEEKQGAFEALNKSLSTKEKGTFANKKLELRFQQYFAQVIKRRSTPILAENYAKAYMTVLMSEGLSEEEARKETNKVVEKTVERSFKRFDVPKCSGNFAIRSKNMIDFSKKQTEDFKKRYLERKERANKKRAEREKSNRKSEDEKDPSNDGNAKD